MKDGNIYKFKLKISDSLTVIITGSNLLANLHEQPLLHENCAGFILLSDRKVFKLYGKTVEKSLNKLHKKIIPIIVPVGEASKTFRQTEKILTLLLRRGVNRNYCLICLGGGVVSDLGGLVASLLFRGIRLILLPTTLLAQVDAAIGGKTGVDFRTFGNTMYKNMIGTFYQPSEIICDVDTLKSLPKSEIDNGLGEIFKYWVCFGRPLISQMIKLKTSINESKSVARIIFDCQKRKTEIVKQDPYDKLHIREKLNLGHTIGHAIEGAANGKLSHGQAVAIGTAAAAKISLISKRLPEDKYNLIINNINKLGLPVSVKNIDIKTVLTALNFDKKVGTFVLINDIGDLTTGAVVDKNIIYQVLREIII